MKESAVTPGDNAVEMAPATRGECPPDLSATKVNEGAILTEYSVTRLEVTDERTPTVDGESSGHSE